MRVSEEPVWIDLFLPNPVFTPLHLKSAVHVVPPLFAFSVFALVRVTWAEVIQKPEA
jgi:hypothetical protein